jgi:hypothetical protein
MRQEPETEEKRDRQMRQEPRTANIRDSEILWPVWPGGRNYPGGARRRLAAAGQRPLRLAAGCRLLQVTI